MALDPDSLTDAKLVRNLLANAERLGEGALALKCQVRLAVLAGQDFSDPVQRDFWQAVTIAEELASKQNGRTTRLSRTRQKEKRVGARQCLIDWAIDPKTTQGFELLIEGGNPGMTGEAVVIRHSGEFPAEVVAMARAKLMRHGVDVEGLHGTARGTPE